MIDIKLIRDNPQKLKTALKNRGRDFGSVDEILKLDEQKRKLQTESEKIKAEQNKIAKQPSETEIKKLKEIKEKLSGLKTQLTDMENKLNELLLELPNIPFDDVPVGKDENDNKELRQSGKKPDFSAYARGASASGGKSGSVSGGRFTPKDYLELAENLDLIDIKRAAKISGSRFGFLKNEAALLELKLVNLAFEILTKEGFIPIFPPVMVTEEIMRQTGHLSKTDAKEKYFIPEDKIYLVGSSEQSVISMHKDEIFDEKDLPKRYVAFSTCFRREAGSYGKDTKGILRVHQFDKVEMISFVKPEDSEKELDYLISLQEKIMQKLGLHYRVMAICTGDMGFTAARQYDIETWFPVQGKYRETHSASNCTDFQTRRLNIKYRPKTSHQNKFDAGQAKKPKLKVDYVHALNATGIAMGRTIIALIENYQTKDGRVKWSI